MSNEQGEPPVPSREPAAGDHADADKSSDLDQTAADTDQTGADLDRTAADADQRASDRDQLAAERDQEAADEDQAVRVRTNTDAGNGRYARTRHARTQSGIDRDLATHARSESSRVRDEAAARRDRTADERDAAACARDRLAAELDAEIEWLESDGRGESGESTQVGLSVLLRAAGDRKRAAASRAQAAEQREAAARDREQAARDREQAAADRATAAAELALEGIDHLTGALRRRVGLGAIQREMDRTRRTGERLVLAFVDVDALKQVNDTVGHAAGDQLLRQVSRSIMHHLRSYDVITRFGGDEFVCSLSGQDPAAVRERFAQISEYLAELADGATISLGLAERQRDDSLDELIRRADAEMIAVRTSPSR